MPQPKFKRFTDGEMDPQAERIRQDERPCNIPKKKSSHGAHQSQVLGALAHAEFVSGLRRHGRSNQGGLRRTPGKSHGDGLERNQPDR